MILQIHILGKYEFSVNTPLNQIQNYVLGGIIGGIIYNNSISILTFLIILLIWSLVVVIIKLLINNKIIRAIIVGNPVMLIKNGKVNVENCAQVGLSADQLMLHLRMEGVSTTKDVKSAIMEPNGKLTILDKNSESPKFPLISNGYINYDVLELINQKEEWLFNTLNKQGFKSAREIFLAEYQNKQLYITPYSKRST
ncbi:uncharacterized membrane protein YcaP (DUF421 family) [Streptococcus gallinaceus]|uniref:Uncharacterized membrane protein YcaP (DUF421 family) n=2 Tax=Streptococcus gallinaceus TaxID=165758 RepID=A0ABV2JJW4_9STRE|nr:uncharacterized membrane protein YcaP (DUF421 family) [Streptococcus gallinaceus]MCP1769930.1 uncharacterized membrane protein YcaP (DUF421 family) [Streptococcus gallinaceus]